MNRKALWWAVLVIGVVLIVAPLAMGMPGKAAAGQRMLNGFHPIMQPASVQKTADYYNNVFVPLGQITPLFSNANADKFQGYLQGMQASGLKIPPAAAKDFTQLVGVMKQSVPVAQQVPGRARLVQAARHHDAGERRATSSRSTASRTSTSSLGSSSCPESCSCCSRAGASGQAELSTSTSEGHIRWPEQEVRRGAQATELPIWPPLRP